VKALPEGLMNMAGKDGNLLKLFGAGIILKERFSN